MSVKYELRPYALGTAGQHRGNVLERGMLSRQQLIDQLTKAGSILKPTECEAVLQAFGQQLAQNALEGYGYADEFLKCSLSIKGTFEGPDDRFDPKRHTLQLNVQANKALNEPLQAADMQFAAANSLAPSIQQVADWKSRTENNLLSPGHPIEIKGTLLKITNPDDPEQGVFFQHQESKQWTRHQFLYDNLPKTLSLTVPNTLPQGQYQVEVRTKILEHHKKLRAGRLNVLVQVV